jgi:predicted nucleic acid-binding protein
MRRALKRHRRIAIDSNVLIYVLDDDPKRAEIASEVLDMVAAGDVEGVIASIGVVEALVGPARADDGPRFELAAATIRDLGLEIVDMGADVAEDAAWLRGRTGLTLADAVHVASAHHARATALVTNDRRIRARRDLEVIYLDDHASDLPPS